MSFSQFFFKFISIALLVCTVSGLASCSHKSIAKQVVTVQYEKMHTFRHYGYKEKYLGANAYRITAAGHSYTPLKRLKTIARLRAAQIGIEKQFKYHKIFSEKVKASCQGNSSGAEAIVYDVIINATYSNTKVDAQFQSSAQRFKDLKPRLNEKVTTENRIDAKLRIDSFCNRKMTGRG